MVTLKEKTKKGAIVVQTLRRKMKELKIKSELSGKFQRRLKKGGKKREKLNQETLGKDGKNKSGNNTNRGNPCSSWMRKTRTPTKN